VRKAGPLIVVLLLLTLLMVTGCSKTEPTNSVAANKATTSSFDTAPITTTLIQATPSGVLFMLSNGIAESLNKTYPGSVLHVTPGNPTSNVDRLVRGEAEFALTYNTSTMSAVEGKEREPQPELKAIAALKTSPMQFVLKEDIGALTLDDIINKQIKLKLCIGLPDSVTEQTFIQVLQQYKLTKADMQGWGCVFVNKGPEETAQMFSDGAIDGYFYSLSAPHPSIMKNALDKKISMITINPDVIDAVCQTYGYEKITIPAGSYTFLTEDYHTFTDYIILSTTDKVSNETAYKIARSLHQNIEYITLIHSALRDLSEEKMVKKLKVPIHPGALIYYQEAGLVQE